MPESLESLARDYHRLIRETQPKGPYHLLGWSMGGYLAHSIACLLQEQGEQVASLILWDSYPPSQEGWKHSDGEPDIQMGPLLTELFGIDLNEEARTPLNFDRIAARLQQTEFHEFNVRRLKWIEQWARHSPGLMRGFSPGRFDGDMLLFIASEGATEKPELWSSYVGGHIEAHEIRCGHMEMARPGPIAEIGRILAEYLKSRQQDKRVGMAAGSNHSK